MHLSISQDWASSSTIQGVADQMSNHIAHPIGLSPFGKTIENRICSSSKVDKVMRPAHRWSQLRNHARQFKKDVAVAQMDISALKKRIKDVKSDGVVSKILNKDKREISQQPKHERTRGVVIKGSANDDLRMVQSDMKIFKKNQLLPGHVTDKMIDTHSFPSHH